MHNGAHRRRRKQELYTPSMIFYCRKQNVEGNNTLSFPGDCFHPPTRGNRSKGTRTRESRNPAFIPCTNSHGDTCVFCPVVLETCLTLHTMAWRILVLPFRAIKHIFRKIKRAFIHLGLTILHVRIPRTRVIGKLSVSHPFRTWSKVSKACRDS